MSLLNKFKKIVQTAASVKNTKMAIIVRTDLKMGKGKIASQAAHAAVSLYEAALTSGSPHVKLWFLQGQPKVVLRAESYDTLMNIYLEAKSCNFNTCAIHDAGRTQVETGTLTAVGIGPNDTDKINKLTKELKLL